MSLRALYLQNAVANCEPPITLERVAALLPEDFGLDQDELDAAMVRNATNHQAETENASDGASTAENSTKSETSEAPARIAELTGEWDTMPPPSVAEAKQLLDEARVGVRVLSDKLRIARGRLADCLQRYMASRGAAAPTPDELRRDFCRQETENRKAKASGLVSPRQPTHGNSKLDRSLYYQGKQAGDVDDFGAVSGTGHRRGAFPASQRGRRLKPATV
jgi:hypothetical protein